MSEHNIPPIFRRMPGGPALPFLLVLAVATFVRLGGAINDLWLDEIWSVETSRDARSALDVFTSLHHEINHYLNTLWIYAVGVRANWWGYRLPAVICGIATVILAWRIGSRRSVAEGWFAMILVGVSYPLVLYSSEARGYSTAVFFAFAAFHLLQLHIEKPRWILAAGFALCEIGGLASHLAFVNILLATLAWSAWQRVSSQGNRSAGLLRAAALHIPSWLFLAFLYFADIRHLQVGGGTNASSLIGSFGSALAWAVGSTGTSRVTLVVCIAAVVLLHAAFVRMIRERDDDRVFMAGAVLVFPILLVLVRSSDSVYPRHFLLSIAFFQLLLARLAAHYWQRGGSVRRNLLVVVAASVLLNAWSIGLLFAYGRGQNAEMVRFLAQSQPATGLVTVGADNDMRVPMVIRHNAAVLTGGTPVRYFEGGTWPPGGVEFFIRSQEAFEPPYPETIRHYTLVRSFRAAPLAGLHFFVYRKDAP